jgi:membrane protease YdiL (CAAX protease family)
MSGEGLTDAEVWVVRLGLVLSQVVGFGGSAVLAARLSGSVPQALGLGAARPRRLLALAAGVGAVCIPVAGFFSLSPESVSFPEGLQPLEEALRNTEDQVRGMLRQVLSSHLWANVLVVALAPAVCEELFFRGFLQRSLLRYMPAHAAVWLTGFIFSLIHFQVYGFFARWFLGVALGYLAVWSRSLWPSVVAHFVINALQAVGAYWAYTTATGQGWVEDSSSIPYTIGLPAVALCILGLWAFKRMASARPANEA